MEKDAKIYVAGHQGLVGSALVRALERKGYASVIGKTHAEMELTDQSAVETFFSEEKPTYVFLAAAKVGGIHANSTYPAEFAYSNLQIQNNVIHAAWRHGVKRLCFLGSSCIYPKHAPQPIPETALMSGPLEPTNSAYAISKIAGIAMCKSYNLQYGTEFISVMPTNLYGINDNYHPENAHVLPALIRRMHEAKQDGAGEVIIWGTGNPLREFLFADDLADACIFLMDNYNENEHINIGSGVETSIRELAFLIKKVVGYSGRLTFDVTRPDGTPRKLLDSGKIHALGWTHTVDLAEGIEQTCRDFISRQALTG